MAGPWGAPFSSVARLLFVCTPAGQTQSMQLTPVTAGSALLTTGPLRLRRFLLLAGLAVAYCCSHVRLYRSERNAGEGTVVAVVESLDLRRAGRAGEVVVQEAVVLAGPIPRQVV